MKYSNQYNSRHGFANFEDKTFKITNSKDDSTIDCVLIKVPTYSFKHRYFEKISESGGWYSKGDKITKTITHDFYWLIVLENQCLGIIEDNLKKSLRSKYAIKNLNSLKYVKEYLKTI